MGRHILIGSTEKLIFNHKIQQSGIKSQDSALVAEGAIEVLIKSLLLVLEKSHNLVFSWDIVTTQTRIQTKDKSDKKTANEKEGE